MEERKEKKCIVFNCTNHSDDGKFHGDFCYPCWEFICTGKGKYSQLYRNANESELKDYKTVYFALGKKAGMEEVQNGIIEALGLYDRFDKKW